MTVAAEYPIALDLVLPWQEDEQQKEKFKRTLKRLLVPLLLLFIVIPFLPTVDKAFEEREIDIVKTEIILEPLIEEPVATPEPVVVKPKPKPQPKPVQKKPVKPQEKKSVAKEQKKKDVAESQGLTAISSQLNTLRQSLDLQKLQQKNVSTSQGGQIARADSSVLGTDQLTQKSEGIVVDDSMMKSENIALAMHESTKLDGFIDDGAPDVSDAYYSDLRGQRSVESIRRVLESGKSKAQLFYLRQLREQPELAGTFVFELVIEPNGTVSDLKLVSSELNAPDLESKILRSVRQLDFGAEDVNRRKIQYKFNFLPS